MPYRITENCTGCTACAKRCPTDAITGERSMLHVIDPDLCIDCGACGVVCPDEAIWDQRGILCDFLKSKERPKAYVVEERCTGCEWCVWSCPFDALYMRDGSDPAIFQKVAEVDLKRCTGCKVCELDCPYDAIHIFRQDQVPANRGHVVGLRHEMFTDRLP
jgi:ferredoxin